MFYNLQIVGPRPLRISDHKYFWRNLCNHCAEAWRSQSETWPKACGSTYLCWVRNLKVTQGFAEGSSRIWQLDSISVDIFAYSIPREVCQRWSSIVIWYKQSIRMNERQNISCISHIFWKIIQIPVCLMTVLQREQHFSLLRRIFSSAFERLPVQPQLIPKNWFCTLVSNTGQTQELQKRCLFLITLLLPLYLMTKHRRYHLSYWIRLQPALYVQPSLKMYHKLYKLFFLSLAINIQPHLKPHLRR